MRLKNSVAIAATCALLLPAGVIAAASLAGASTTGIRITEWQYNGVEFFELTNLSADPIDLTGWAYSDSARNPSLPTTSASLTPFGAVAAGESVIVTEEAATSFRTVWNLNDSVKVIGNLSPNLGRSDEINIYDADGTLVDRLTYNDQGTGDVKGPRTDDSSAWAPAASVGQNVAASWVKSTIDDAEGSWLHSGGTFKGSPGNSTLAGKAPGNPNAPVGPVDPEPEPGVSDLDLIINEVKTNPNPDFVELKNVGTELIDVAGLKVADPAASPVTITTESTPLLPGEFFVFNPDELPGGFGLGAADKVTILEADGLTVVDEYAWTSHRMPSFGYCPDATERIKTAVPTPGAENICHSLRINEIESDAGDPDDWIELTNVSDEPVDAGGWVVKDNDDTNGYTIPAGTTLGAGEYLVIERDALGFGLGAGDAVRLFRPVAAAPVEQYTWTAHAATTYGRCANGVGDFVTTRSATKGAANDCPPPFHGVTVTTWPGSADVTPSDPLNAFVSTISAGDVSGLAFDRQDDGVLWAIKNKNRLFKLTKVDGLWTPVTADGWAGGKELRFPDGSGEPDTEGLTVGPDGAIYATTERDNVYSGIPRNGILRYDPLAEGTTLVATHEWDLTAEFPELGTLPGGSNLGFEGITWVPDSYLVDEGFVDESTNAPYDPAVYPGHGSGLYFAALENDAALYAYALSDTASHRVARIASGFAKLADVTYDPERGQVWAVTDDTQDGQTSQLAVGDDGKFAIVSGYLRPENAPNLNNEGFAIAPQATCTDGFKEVIWADDSGTGGHSLRSGTIECTALNEEVPGGENPGGENPGGENPGGENPGGENPGGENPGGQHPAPGNPGKLAQPTVAVTAPKAPFGARAKVTVKISAAGKTPTGTVRLRVGAKQFGAKTLRSGVATLVIARRALTPGKHAVSATYSGDANVAAKSGKATLRVVKAAAKVSVTVSKPIRKGVTRPLVRVAVKVADGVTANGRVRVTLAGRNYAAKLKKGKATIRLRPVSKAGKRRITVRYSGSPLVKAGKGTTTVRVTR